MKILITGCAGFIGYHLSSKILQNKNIEVYGIDNLNTYYDVDLKKSRLKKLKKNKKFNFKKIDITDNKKIQKEFQNNKFNIVIHLAAQAGVRYSINNPRTYLDTNINGFFNILESSKDFKVSHFIFASTSSVYGDGDFFPLKESHNTDGPLSFYAATKKSNEVMAYAYSNIYKIKVTGLRFFTVYGPYGRPDMALFKFTKSILNSEKIKLFNKGDHVRDFTYIDDVVESIVKIIKKPSKKSIPYQIINIGSNNPQKLSIFLKYIEQSLGKKAKYKKLPMQKGDVYKTHANISTLIKQIDYTPKIGIKKGVENFINWYKGFYKQ